MLRQLLVAACFSALLVRCPGCLATASLAPEKLSEALKRSVTNRLEKQTVQKTRYLLEIRRSATRTLQASRAFRKRASRGECSWNEATADCELSSSAAGEFLNDLKSDFASLVAQFAACEGADSKTSCARAGECFWDAYDQRCYFLDIRLGQTSSPCLEAAPFVIGTLADPPCSPLTEKACSARASCSWVHDGQECIADFFLYLFGFSFAEFEEGRDTLYDVWTDLFLSVFEIDSPDFEWSSVLRWKVPAGMCPYSVCDFMDRGMRPIMPNRIYCINQYYGAHQKSYCNRDAYCQYDDTLDYCAVGSSLDSFSASFQPNLDWIEGKIDREVFVDSLECAGISEKRKCKGKCAWDIANNLCDLKTSKAFRKLPAVDKRGADPLCKYIAAAADSKCLDIQKEGDCEELSACTWRALDQSCVPSVSYLTEVAAEEAGAKKSLKRLQKRCTKHYSFTDC